MNIKNLLISQKENDKCAIRFSHYSISYRQWYNKAQEVSDLLLDYTMSKNIIIMIPNSINYAISYFGVIFSDHVVVPINPDAKKEELLSTCRYCESDLIITDDAHESLVTDYLKEYEYKICILNIDKKTIIALNTAFRYIDKADNDLDDVAIMLHTSGTTNNPKRVMLTHNNLIANINSNIESLNFTVNDKVLIALPMYFGYCNTAQFLTHLKLGASIVIYDGIFLPKRFFEIIEKEKITNFTAVPTMLLMLKEYRYYDKYDIASLRIICFGGGNMPVEHLKTIINRFPTVGFVQTYGQTEASPRITALLPKDSIRKIGSVGLPIPNVEVKVISSDSNDNSRNIGQIIVKGKNVMKGYYKNKEKTRDTIVDGWLYTGDLGYFDDDGYLYLTGRIKNMIISGGINIYPEEVEGVIMQYPGISAVHVFAEEHKLLGEVPIAKIVSNNCNVSMLIEYCKERLSEYKIPVRFEFVKTLSRTYNGKIKRH